MSLQGKEISLFVWTASYHETYGHQSCLQDADDVHRQVPFAGNGNQIFASERDKVLTENSTLAAHNSKLYDVDM